MEERTGYISLVPPPPASTCFLARPRHGHQQVKIHTDLLSPQQGARVILDACSSCAGPPSWKPGLTPLEAPRPPRPPHSTFSPVCCPSHPPPNSQSCRHPMLAHCLLLCVCRLLWRRSWPSDGPVVAQCQWALPKALSRTSCCLSPFRGPII